MKKVVYSIKKAGRNEDFQLKGIGYITDEDLIIACISKTNKPYIRVFEDCIKNCHLVIGKTDEYKGTFYEIHTVEEREYEAEYYIWYKLAD